MDFSVIAVGDVQNVLSAMQKNLECPICLEVIKEPVSTKCDHIFCRFCMFKLLSRKKKGVTQCPLCKTEVTKRSLKENSRFKQLIEGLLETIHAFELDTGVKFLNSRHFPKPSTEGTAAEFPCKEDSVIQSKGFRNRRSTDGNGQENCTLEANVDMQLTESRVNRRSLRNQPQKCGSQKGIYIEFGSDSSEEVFKQSSNTGLKDKEALQISAQEKLEELKSAEMGNEYSCGTQHDKLGAEDIILPNVIGESNPLKEVLSKKSTQSITECAQTDQVNMTEYQSSPFNVLAGNLLTEQCDTIGNASPLRSEDTSFFKNTEEMDAEQPQCNSKSKEFDLKGSSASRLDKSKEIDVAQRGEAVEMDEPENDSSHEKELPLEKLLQPEPPHCAALNPVSRKRLKRSIQKVNEWFSKSNEILSSSSSQGDSAGAADISGEGDACLSDKDSCISEKTDPMVDCVETAVVEGNERSSKQTAESIKDKIFGKTYKRERKSNPSVVFFLPPAKKEDVAADKFLDHSSKDRLKRKRRIPRVLQPEDFIRKRGTEEANGSPQSVNWCLGDVEKSSCDASSAVNENQLSENREDNTLVELEEPGGSVWKKATEKVPGKHSAGELKLSDRDQKSTKKSSAAKRCRRSTRSVCALQLVVDRSSDSADAAEPQIDSYPSSEEPRKADSEHRQIRRSRRLQLLSEELAKEAGKGVEMKGARKCDSDHEGASFRVQTNALVHTSTCKDLDEPWGESGSKSLTNLKGADLEENEIQISLKNSSDPAGIAKAPFNPTSSCQHSACSSFVPDTGSQDGEVQGSPLLQFPSVAVVQTASHPTEEMTEPCTGCDTPNIPGDLRTEKLPMAENVLELTKDAEGSELDTLFVQNIFRHSKRQSFSLHSIPKKVCAVEDAASETSKTPCADQVENKQSNYFKPEHLKGEKTTAESLSIVYEEEKNVSQVANRATLTPMRMGAAGTEDKSRLQEEEQGKEKTLSTDTGIKGKLRRNPIQSNRRQSDQADTRTDTNTDGEICFNSENSQAGKAKVVDDRGPIEPFHSGSMICPAPCQQRAAEFSCEVTGEKSRRESKPVKEDDEGASQAASTGMPKLSFTEASEESCTRSSDFTGLSETPDGFLYSDDEIGENISFSAVHRRERSAVFAKRGDNALEQELHNKSGSSKSGSQHIQRPRRRAQKLQSSDEESSEDEDLPCFQALIFGKSVSTPSQSSKPATSVVEFSVSPITLPHTGSDKDYNMQKMPEAALNNECISPSQESECSVNLFSSQSNMSEESIAVAQQLKIPSVQAHTSKQVNNVTGSKETFQSGNGGLKRSKTSSKDERQEDPNMAANLGEAPAYDSETSNVEDSCELFSQGEILTTQQKNIMQNNLKKLQQEMAVLEAVLKQHGSQDCELSPIPRELPHSSSEGTPGMEQMRQGENADEQKCGTRLSSASVLSNLSGNVAESSNNSSSSLRLLNPQTAEATNSSVVTQKANKSCAQESKSKRSVCFPLSALHNASGKENLTSPVMTNRKAMSIVASGLSQSEHLVVQKFVRKTQSTLSNHVTEGTTHIIMKTDKELVCERTLKYFLGIAGRKWVVSYQWVIQSFEEGRILNEENFEVRGDVINGRNHQGPKRARQSLTEKIFKDFEICCYGPFTDMTTEHLEWMVELCGASVVKQLHLFTHPPNSSAVVVVQPDAWMENTDYRAIQQKDNVAMVTREWVLDSVACYECQEFDAYLVS
ncbi:BRCA1 protein, partial [Amazona guildingii]|nr:BRCA1 protein [Amazona guildingii]